MSLKHRVAITSRLSSSTQNWFLKILDKMASGFVVHRTTDSVVANGGRYDEEVAEVCRRASLYHSRNKGSDQLYLCQNGGLAEP